MAAEGTSPRRGKGRDSEVPTGPPEPSVVDSLAATADASIRLQATPLFGRDEILAFLTRAVLEEHVRLLTITGPGGMGKTRIAVELATRLGPRFPDGLAFLDEDANIAGNSAAQTIRVALQSPPGHSDSVHRAIQAIAPKRMLVIVDGFETAGLEAVRVGELVARCPNLGVIVTNREPLHLRWEHVQPLPPLAVPDGEAEPLARIEANPCVQLFLHHARAIVPDFTITESNASEIVEICRRLDGLPLAIELAAARVNVLTPSGILQGLGARGSLLQQSGPDVPERHTSLDASMDATYRALSEPERELLGRLAVFVDGFALTSARALTSDWTDSEILDAAGSLVDKSLVQSIDDEDTGTRFSLPSSVQSYMLDRSENDGDLEPLYQAHCGHFLLLAEQSAIEISGLEQDRWCARIEREYGNITAALQWASRSQIEAELRFAIALTPFWVARGRSPEGIGLLSSALDHNPGSHVALQLDGLHAFAELLYADGQLDRAGLVVDDALDLARTTGSPEHTARILMIDAWRRIAQGNGEEAGLRLDEALNIWRQANNVEQIARTLRCQSVAQLRVGAVPRAEMLAAESLSVFERRGDALEVIRGLLVLARATALRGKADDAAGLIQEALERSVHAWVIRPMLGAVEHVAWFAASTGAFEAAAYLCAGADSVRETHGFSRDPLEQSLYDETLAPITDRLHQSIELAAYTDRHTDPGKLADEAQERLRVIRVSGEISTPGSVKGSLSEREYQVLQLVAEGLSNRQIAQRLSISENTAKFHVSAILSKLGAENRAGIVALAARRNILQQASH